MVTYEDIGQVSLYWVGTEYRVGRWRMGRYSTRQVDIGQVGGWILVTYEDIGWVSLYRVGTGCWVGRWIKGRWRMGRYSTRQVDMGKWVDIGYVGVYWVGIGYVDIGRQVGGGGMAEMGPPRAGFQSILVFCL